MTDILKSIKEQLNAKITEANFEGANIVLYTDNENFFKEGEGKIKEIVEQIKKEKSDVGFNAQNFEFTDMFKAGIVDPLKVTRSALQNAASIAAMLLTTEALIAEKPEKEKSQSMPSGMPGGGYGDMM